MNSLSSSHLSPWRVSRFDKVVWAAMLTLIALTAVVLWRYQPAETAVSPRIVYIAWDENDNAQLYAIAPPDGEPQQLTQTTSRIFDFAVSPDGRTIIYTLFRQDGGSDLWQLTLDDGVDELLLACEGMVCRQPVWYVDGRRLIYERLTAGTANTPEGLPRLWWLDTTSGETVSVFQDSQMLGSGADFSGDGRWLAYLVPVANQIHAYNLETGASANWSTQSGERPIWHPAKASLLYTDIHISDDKFAVHLFQADPTPGDAINLSGADAAVNDGVPAWSPDGQWIAFGRKTPYAMEGEQIWQMRPDGSDMEQLTTQLNLNFSRPYWSRDGRYLTFQGFDIEQPANDPAIYLFDLENRQLQKITAAGVQPRWLE